MSTILEKIASKISKEKFAALKLAFTDGGTDGAGTPAASGTTENNFTMEDGNMLSLSKAVTDAVGAECSITTNGSTVPAPDGAYTVTDSTGAKYSMEVKDGKVTEWEVATPTAPAPDESAMKEMQSAITNLQTELKAMKEKSDSFKSEVTASEFNSLKEENAKLKTTMSDMFAIVEAIAEMPSEPSAVDNKSQFAKDKEDKLKAFSSQLQKVKDSIKK